MFKRLPIVLAALATTAAVGGVAIAAHAPAAPDGPAMGPVTRAEAQARAEQAFARMDINADGKLDSADRAAHMARMFDTIDADHNGQISREEFTAHHARRPGPGEMDHGGMDHGNMQAGPEGHRGKPHGMMGGMMMEHMAAMADADKDGAVSKAEFTAAALARFDRADTNKDGTVTPAERRAAMDSMRQHMREMRREMRREKAAG